MIRNASDESSDGDGERGGGPSTKSLSCRWPGCEDTKFANLSKLNKHRNAHTKPYKCEIEYCNERFAHRQILDRHVQHKHSDASTPTKYYHCTVDGCKYSSTSGKKKRFARADQVKEHIKDYGHYAPHSANDRMRRPGTPLFAEQVVTIFFEEWTLDENEESQPRRSVELCQYNSCKTKLWHTDDTGEQYVRVDMTPELERLEGHQCIVESCYYQLRPPDSLKGVVFKTVKDLQEHLRRAHEFPGQMYPFSSQLILAERHDSFSSLGSTAAPSISEFNLSNVLGPNENDHTVSSERSDWTHLFELDDPTLVLEDFSPTRIWSGEDIHVQQLDQSNSFAQAGVPSRMEASSIRPSSAWLQSIHPASISDSDQSAWGLSTAASCISIAGHESIKAPTPTICEVQSCGKVFKRKGDMQRHVESVHRLSSRVFSCALCRREFHRKDKYTDHVRNVHKLSPDSDSMKLKSLFAESSSFSEGGDVFPGDIVGRATSNEEVWEEKKNEYQSMLQHQSTMPS